MNKLTVVTPTIIKHTVTGIKVKRIKVVGSPAATSKFMREGKAVLVAMGLCLVVWSAIAWVIIDMQ